MNIVMICDARSIHYKRWVCDLRGRGHRVTVFSPWKDSSSHEIVEVVGTPRAPFPMFSWLKTSLKMLYRIRLALSIRKRIRKLRPDIVHAHFLTDSGWIAAWTNFHPFVVTVHGSDILIHPQRSLVYRLVVRFVLKRADRVMIVAEHFRDALKRCGCREDKIEFIPNYVDDHFFTTKEEIHNRFRSIQESPRVISARKMEAIYDVETFIRSIPIVLNDHPGVKFSVVGDGEQMERLQHLSLDLGISGSVHFYGRVDHDELIHHFRNHHIYVSTALSDGLAVTTIEALANGLYPVFTDIPANRTLINAGQIGELFPGSDAQALAQKIIDAIAGSDTIESVVIRNLMTTHEQFSSTRIVEKVESLYNRLV
ncbi:glycosyltransferase [candidate division KSB1 bacterium]|nr:glycosyltransferase [candidate division KSB1 bacterium]